MIKIENVHKAYGTGDSRNEVLKGVSLDIEEGDFVVILGTSGSGKSTLLNVISGLESADEGNVYYDTKNLAAMDQEGLTRFRKEYIGYIFQQYFLLPNLNVDKNVKMGADLAGRLVLDYICKLKNDLGFTMVMVTHNQNIADMANTVIRMNSGQIIQKYHNEKPKTAYEIAW